jgi:ureidoacrylate peracid hydrolase
MTSKPAADPTHAALLVIDMQNAFCRDDGSFAKMTADTPLSIAMCQAAIPACRKLVAHARANNIPVIYTRYVYNTDYTDGGILVEKYPDIPTYQSLAKGSWDAEIIDELAPQPDDIILDKSRYSAFYGTNLASILEDRGITHLIVCGVTTNVCVESTVRDAAQADYHVIIASDATGEFTQARHDAALEILDYGFATVTTTDEIVNA